jgi:hypothetical protein
MNTEYRMQNLDATRSAFRIPYSVFRIHSSKRLGGGFAALAGGSSERNT